MSHKKDSEEPLRWVPQVTDEVLARMFRKKLVPSYIRPTHLDVIAQQAVVLSQRSTCLHYEVGAIIFEPNINVVLSSGYNGASVGDVDPRIEGCARVVDGKLKEGAGLCRGSHAELNAMGNLSAGTIGIRDVHMLVTLHPCFSCAKQIVNKRISKVYYLWEYGREDFVTEYLERLGVSVERYTSPFLERWIEHNEYHSVARMLSR